MNKNNELIKVKKAYQQLQERFDEMGDYLDSIIKEHRKAEDNLNYMQDFIHYHRLDEAYLYFREHAHEEEDPENPFPRLII